MGIHLLNFVQTHWWHCAPLLVVGTFALVIILERSHTLFWDFPFPYADAFMEKVKYLVLADRVQEATALCDQMINKPMVRVVKEALTRAHLTEAIIENGIQIAVQATVEKIQERTHYLATLANLSTLMGLLGTIAGLIQAFDAIGNANSAERAQLLATGISVAMNATLLGIAVALPCLVAYSLLNAQSERLAGQIDRGALSILEILRSRLAQADPNRESPGNAGGNNPMTGFSQRGTVRSSITLERKGG